MSYNANRNPDGLTIDINLGPTAQPPEDGAEVLFENETYTFIAPLPPPTPGILQQDLVDVHTCGVVKTGTRIRLNTPSP